MNLLIGDKGIGKSLLWVWPPLSPRGKRCPSSGYGP